MYNVNYQTTMKRIYIAPILQVVTIHTERLVAESIAKYDTGSDGTVLVKGNNGSTTSSSSSYNVWDDDWSK